MIPRLAILTEIISPYRIPGFNALAGMKGIDLRVIFLSKNDPSLRQWRVYKDEIEFEYEVLPGWRQRFGGRSFLINRGLFSALDRIRPTIILSGGYNYPASWQTAAWANFHRVPLVLWSESTGLDVRKSHRLVEFAKRKFVNLCRGFVAPGISAVKYLRELQVHEGQIFVAPNAVDVDLFSGLATVARRNACEVRALHSLPLKYFLYVGRIIRAKGVFDLLEAYARLENGVRENFGLVFVGDGADRAELMRRADRMRHGTIQFAGFIHRDDLPEFYALSEALIFPTYSDTWGLVVNEAMACGLPVVVAGVAGCSADLVRDGVNGFTVRSGNISDLTAAMEQLARNSEMVRDMGARSREQISAYSPLAWAEGVFRAVLSIGAEEL